jgi:hypothetical protein
VDAPSDSIDVRPEVTMSILWEEYRADHPDGYGISTIAVIMLIKIT